MALCNTIMSRLLCCKIVTSIVKFHLHSQRHTCCNLQVFDIFITTCCDKLTSGCVCIACNSLFLTSLLPVISTDLLQVDCQNLLSTGLLQVVSTSCNMCDLNRLQTVKFYFCTGNKKFLQIFCAEAGWKPP